MKCLGRYKAPLPLRRYHAVLFHERVIRYHISRDHVHDGQTPLEKCKVRGEIDGPTDGLTIRLYRVPLLVMTDVGVGTTGFEQPETRKRVLN